MADDDQARADAEIHRAYCELREYTIKHDVRLRGIQRKVIEAYGPDGSTNADLLALMGWCLYELRKSGVPPHLVLCVLDEQVRELEAVDAAGAANG